MATCGLHQHALRIQRTEACYHAHYNPADTRHQQRLDSKLNGPSSSPTHDIIPRTPATCTLCKLRANLIPVSCPQLWSQAAPFHHQSNWIMLEATRPLWRNLTTKLPELQMSLLHTTTLTEAMHRPTSSNQGTSDEQAGPDTSRLAPHLQQEWDHAANAHLGSIIVAPQSNRKAWWSGGLCKTGQPHKWQARVSHRSEGASCPNDRGKAACPCNDLAHNHPEVAAEWDWEANGERTPETVTAGSQIRADWRCSLCGHKWNAVVISRTFHGAGCPQCANEARRKKTRQPSISSGAPHLLAEWDWEANERCGWHPDQVTLCSHIRVHWVQSRREECKLGLVHTWQATPFNRIGKSAGSPFPSGMAVCACNSLAVQCPEAADLWDFVSNEELTPGDVAMQSNKLVAWKTPDGRQWRQTVAEVVNNVRRHRAKVNK